MQSVREYRFPLLLMMGMLALPAVVQAQFDFATNNGALTITSYTGGGGAIKIPSATNGFPITAIGYEAFYDRPITSVTFGTNLTIIGSEAFYGCRSLTSITIPNGVVALGDYAFYQCTSLEKAVIGSGVTDFGQGVFEYCSALANVTLSNGMTSLGQAAFLACSNLVSVTIPPSVTNTGFAPFPDCPRLTSINVDTNNPDFCAVGGVLFDKAQDLLIQYPIGLPFPHYAISNSVTSIGTYSFIDALNLTLVTIPNSVTNIGEGAFYFCDLTNVSIGAAVSSIGNEAFDYCLKLLAITVDTNNPDFCAVGGVLFDKAQDLLIQYPIGSKATNYSVPSTVTAIGDGAFAGCTNLVSITIPSSVANFGPYAFAYCSSLKSMYYLGDAPDVFSDTFQSDANATLYYRPETLGWTNLLAGTGMRGVSWDPQFQHDLNFGFQSNSFGFDIMGGTNLPIVVEASTNLVNPVWIPLKSCNLTNGAIHFRDADWTNYPSRFYRINMP